MVLSKWVTERAGCRSLGRDRRMGVLCLCLRHVITSLLLGDTEYNPWVRSAICPLGNELPQFSREK